MRIFRVLTAVSSGVAALNIRLGDFFTKGKKLKWTLPARAGFAGSPG